MGWSPRAAAGSSEEEAVFELGRLLPCCERQVPWGDVSGVWLYHICLPGFEMAESLWGLCIHYLPERERESAKENECYIIMFIGKDTCTF